MTWIYLLLAFFGIGGHDSATPIHGSGHFR